MDLIISLLQEWKKYSDQGNPGDFFLFGQWLQKHHAEKPTYNPEGEDFPIEPMLGFFLGNLMGYTESWTKLAFADLPLKGLTDFGILKYIEKNDKPTKREVAKYALAEDSTVFEVMKRLQKQGFIKEATDENDRRVKHVFLTNEGTKLIRTATDKTFKLSRLLVGNLDQEEKAIMMKMLEKLQTFHHKLYQEVPRDSIKKEYDL